MHFTQTLCLLMLIILSLTCLVENRSYNTGLIFYNLDNQQLYLPPTISVSRGRSLATFKYSSRGSIWSTFGKPCDCKGPLCGCCVGMKVKQYNFNQKICANVSYAPIKDEIQLEVLLNDTSTAKYGIAARNPSPLCIPIMMGIPMSMCVQMSNVGLMGDNLNMCMDFMVRLASSDLFEMHFQCMKVGLQGASWVGPDGQPVIPANEGKLKDKSTGESEEYCDESVGLSAENEISSQEKEDKVHSAGSKEEINNTEEDINKAEEEVDYNDITEKAIEDVEKQEDGMVLSNEIENEKEITQESIALEQLLETEDSNTETGTTKNVINIEESQTTETISHTTENPVTEEIKEAEINQMKQNTTQAVDNVETNLMEENMATENILESQTLSQDLFTNYMENAQAENMDEEVDNVTHTEAIAPTNSESLENKSQIQMMFFNVSKETESGVKDTMSMTTENNYAEQTLQSVDKVEHTIHMNKTSQESEISLETNTKHSTTISAKPTLAAAVNVAETTSETGIDNSDNVLTTGSATAATTTTTTMKMPFLLAEEANLAVPATVSTTNHHDNDVNDNDNNDDNSEESGSDYDDDESEEFEDETTEKVIETNDATTITNAIMTIATNDLNTEKSFVSSEAIKKNENNLTNSSNSNESISQNEDENDEDEDEAQSDEYEEDEYEDYDTTTIKANETLKPFLLNKTYTTNEPTTEDKMMEKDAVLMMSLDNNLSITNIASQMTPQLSADTLATTTTTIGSSTVTTSTSTTTAMPLPLARKLFAPHQR